MKKSSKLGITMIEMVVVIIILILLAVVAIWKTGDSMERAEAMVVLNEFKAVYNAASSLRESYNLGYDLTEGKDYSDKLADPSGDWYVVYGVDVLQQEGKKDLFNEEIITQHLGIDELKRSYDFRWMDNNGNELKDVQVRIHDGKYVIVSGYNVRTYEELQNIRSEITK